MELRTFRVPGLEGDEGAVVFKIDGDVVLVVEVRRGTGTLSTRVEGPARVVANFDSRETLEAIVEGRLHPIVAALQGRLELKGDLVFGLKVILGLQGGSPAANLRREG
jgi:putative sterol carrier protein